MGVASVAIVVNVLAAICPPVSRWMVSHGVTGLERVPKPDPGLATVWRTWRLVGSQKGLGLVSEGLSHVALNPFKTYRVPSRVCSSFDAALVGAEVLGRPLARISSCVYSLHTYM